MGLMGVIAIATSSFNALGRPNPPLMISVIQMLCLSVPFALIGNEWFGYIGIMWGSDASRFVTARLSFFWLRFSIKPMNLDIKRRSNRELGAIGASIHSQAEDGHGRQQ